MNIFHKQIILAGNQYVTSLEDFMVYNPSLVQSMDKIRKLSEKDFKVKSNLHIFFCIQPENEISPKPLLRTKIIKCPQLCILALGFNQE